MFFQPENQDIVPPLDLSGPFFQELVEHSFLFRERLVAKILDGCKGVLWLTRSS